MPGGVVIEDAIIRLSAETATLRRDLNRSLRILHGFQRKVARRTRAIRGHLRLGIVLFGGRVLMNSLRGMIRPFREFEKGLSQIQAKSEATKFEVIELGEHLKHLSVETIFTANEVMAAAIYMAQAGLPIAEIKALIGPTLNLAAAAGTAADKVADIMTNIQLGMSIPDKELPAVADVLSRVVTSSNTNIIQLGEAMKFAAPTAKALGLSLTEMTAIIAKMADAGIKGTLAGTAFRRALAQLVGVSNDLTTSEGILTTTITKQAAVFRKYGIQLQNTAEGGVELLELLVNLDRAGAGADDFIKVFGARMGPKFYASLSQGSDELLKLVERLEESQDIALKKAEIQTKNLDGAFKFLKSSWERLWLDIFEAGLGRALTRATLAIRNWIKDVTPSITSFFAQMAIRFGGGDLVSIPELQRHMDKATKKRDEFREKIDKLIENKPEPSVFDKALGDANIFGDLKNWEARMQSETEGWLYWERQRIGATESYKKVVKEAQTLMEGLEPKEKREWENYWGEHSGGKTMSEGVKEKVFIDWQRKRGGDDGGEKSVNKYDPYRAVSSLSGYSNTAFQDFAKFAFGQDKMLDSMGNNWWGFADQVAGALAFTANAMDKHNKKQFKAWKAFAMAQAIMNTALAITRAWSELGPIAAPIATAIIAAMGAAQLGIIASQKFQGQAHAGLERVPREGTYLLDKGEGVLNPATNERLNKMLDDYEGIGGRQITINAMDPVSFRDFLLRNPRALNAGMARANLGALA